MMPHIRGNITISNIIPQSNDQSVIHKHKRKYNYVCKTLFLNQVINLSYIYITLDRSDKTILEK